LRCSGEDGDEDEACAYRDAGRAANAERIEAPESE